MKHLFFDEKLYEYVKAHSIKGLDILEDMYNKAMADENNGYNTPLVQLHFIYMICKIYNPKYLLDIGIFRGLSAVAMSLGTESDANISMLDINCQNYHDYQSYWKMSGLSAKSNIYIDKAEETLNIFAQANKKFDFSYIDANKLAYKQYYELVLSMTTVGGIILIDNVLWKGQVLNQTNKIGANMSELNLIIANDQRVEAFILPMEDGLYMIRKK